MEDFKFIETRSLNEGFKPNLFEIWNNVYPERIGLKNLADLDHYLRTISEIRHILLTNHSDKILGWAYTFNRENERWFSIILSDAAQGKGIGRVLIEMLKEGENELNGWVIDHDEYLKPDGKPYISPLGFFKKCGFELIPNIRLEKQGLSAAKIRWKKQQVK